MKLPAPKPVYDQSNEASARQQIENEFGKRKTDEQNAAAYQPANANLAAEAGLTGAADRVSYYTGPGAKALATLTTFGRSLIAAADAVAVRALLSLGSAALKNVGTSGDTVPLLNAAASWNGGVQTFVAPESDAYAVRLRARALDNVSVVQFTNNAGSVEQGTIKGTNSGLAFTGAGLVSGTWTFTADQYIGGNHRFYATSGDATIINQFFAFNGLGGFIGTLTNHPLFLRVNDQDRAKIDTAGDAWLWLNGALKKVETGAADSGGAGYRMLRCVN